MRQKIFKKYVCVGKMMILLKDTKIHPHLKFLCSSLAGAHISYLELPQKQPGAADQLIRELPGNLFLSCVLGKQIKST